MANFEITPFDIRWMEQLELLLPEAWNTSAYSLFLINEKKPWFHPYQVIIGNKLVGFGMVWLNEDVAWLGWILVDQQFRNRGIGTSITHFLVEQSKAMGAEKIILTATELGRPIYERFGFRVTSIYRFFKRQHSELLAFSSSSLRQATADDLGAVLAIDRMATGEDRRILIEYHLPEITVSFSKQKVNGFFAAELGVGFVAALTPKAGLNLMALASTKTQKSIAIPDKNKTAIDFLISNGFEENPSIPRMALDSKEPAWNPQMIYCRGAGYCG